MQPSSISSTLSIDAFCLMVAFCVVLSVIFSSLATLIISAPRVARNNAEYGNVVFPDDEAVTDPVLDDIGDSPYDDFIPTNNVHPIESSAQPIVRTTIESTTSSHPLSPIPTTSASSSSPSPSPPSVSPSITVIATQVEEIRHPRFPKETNSASNLISDIFYMTAVDAKMDDLLERMDEMKVLLERSLHVRKDTRRQLLSQILIANQREREVQYF